MTSQRAEQLTGAPNPRRAEILGAAAELFARRGYHGASIGDLGRAVGLTGPALYRHFSGKEAVLAEMLLDISERLLAEASAAPPTPTPGAHSTRCCAGTSRSRSTTPH